MNWFKYTLIFLPIALFSHYRVLHNFDGLDGADPKGTLNSLNNVLYGRTTAGGIEDLGVIFSVDTDGKNFNRFYTFHSGLMGNSPHHDAMFFNGSALIGTALYGGITDNGVVFSIVPPDQTTYQTLHQFLGAPVDGAQAHSNVVLFEGEYYGLTAKGGLQDRGSLFVLPTTGGSDSILYNFNNALSEEGYESHGRVTPSDDGTLLWGMTKNGGIYGGGVVFAYDRIQNQMNWVHQFGSFPGDGYATDHGYLVSIGDRLYGMTTNGGYTTSTPSDGYGVIFSLNQSGLDYEILHHFGVDPLDGQQPYGSLAVSRYNLLYGMTRNGGDHGLGTIFTISPDGSNYQKLFSFDSFSGTNPIDNVIVSDDGLILYGMTQKGGLFDLDLSKEYGTVFSYKLPLTSFPPAIQNGFQKPSEQVSARSFFGSSVLLIRQVAAIMERQSDFRRGLQEKKEVAAAQKQKKKLPEKEIPIKNPIFQQKLNFDFVGAYDHVHYKSSNGIPGVHTHAAGGVLMSDVRLTPYLFLGEALGYFNERNTFEEGLGKNNLQSVIGSLYLAAIVDHYFVDAIGSFSWNYYDVSRNIAMWDLTATSKPDGYLGAFDVTAGYYLDVSGFAITPMLGLYFTQTNVNSFTEKHAQSLNQQVSSFSQDSLRTMLGMRFGYDFAISGIHLLPEIEGGWEYECLDQTLHISSSLPTYNYPFTITLPEFNRQFFTWTGQVTAFLSSYCYLEASYEGWYSHNNQNGYSLYGNLALAF